MNNFYIASFDIGLKNFCFYVENLNINNILKIKNISIKNRYKVDRTPTLEFKKILENIYKNGSTVLHENIDLTIGCTVSKSKSKLNCDIYCSMINILDKYKNIWKKCKIIIIEQQMSFRGKYNTLALKLGTHCSSYFYVNFGRYKKIIEFPAYHKTQVLGCGRKVIGKYKNGKIKYKNMTKPQRKKWSIMKAQEIMKIRGENKSKLFLKGKKDDLADTITQLMAFIYLHFIEKKQF